ncbi:MAG: nuclear transport factor 2 family protein [Terriglobales bacterium]
MDSRGGYLTTNETLVKRAYAAFNRRDTDAALALMTPEVRWPKASEGGEVTGRDEIRLYWLRQWSAFDPHVEPLAMNEDVEGKLRVRVRQVVKNLSGEVLSDSEVVHVFTMHAGLIAAMELEGGPGLSDDPAAAFAHRP